MPSHSDCTGFYSKFVHNPLQKNFIAISLLCHFIASCVNEMAASQALGATVLGRQIDRRDDARRGRPHVTTCFSVPWRLKGMQQLGRFESLFFGVRLGQAIFHARCYEDASVGAMVIKLLLEAGARPANTDETTYLAECILPS